MAFRFGMLVGPFGSGKTSLTRPELLDRLETDPKLHPVQIFMNGPDACAATRTALIRAVAPEMVDTKAAAALVRKLSDKVSQSVVLIYDQFDDFFLSPDDGAKRAAFVSWVGACLDDPTVNARFLFVSGPTSLGRCASSRPSQASAPPPEICASWTGGRAAVLRLAVHQGEADFGEGLIDNVVRDLVDDSVISRFLLQVVAASMKRRQIENLGRYQAASRTSGILADYVYGTVKGAPDRLVAETIMGLLGDAGRDPKCHRSLDEIQEAIQQVAPTQAERFKSLIDQVDGVNDTPGDEELRRDLLHRLPGYARVWSRR